jgi:hypothetical protein
MFRTAIEALIRSGHQPSRTLVFSVLLGKVRYLSQWMRREKFITLPSPRLLMRLKCPNTFMQCMKNKVS